MLTRRSGRPPLGLLALMLGVTIVPLVTLLWLGWQLELKERQLEAGQARQHVDQAATLVTAALQRAVAQTGQRVAAGTGTWSTGAVVVTFHRDHVSIAPDHAIAYDPVVERAREAPASAFDEVEEFEFRNVDRPRALETARALAASRDTAIRGVPLDGRPAHALTEFAGLLPKGLFLHPDGTRILFGATPATTEPSKPTEFWVLENVIRK